MRSRASLFTASIASLGLATNAAYARRLGANYTLSPADSFDLAYMYAFVKGAPVNIGAPAAGKLSGK